MKKIIIYLVFLISVTGLAAQPEQINDLFYYCRGEEDVISLYIPGFLCRMAGSFADVEPEERELLNSISSLRILVSENGNLNRRLNFVEEISKGGINKDYYPLLTIHEHDEDVLILGREHHGMLHELIIAVGGEENVLICIKGRMNKDLLESLYEITGVEKCRYTKEI